MTQFDYFLAIIFTKFLLVINRMSYRVGIHTGMNPRYLSELRNLIREREYEIQRMEGI